MTQHNRDAVAIGAAARLFDLPPSTLRWWERAGAIRSSPGRGAHRSYGRAELRRIGLTYLFTTAGRMRLKDAAELAAGPADLNRWQHAVRRQIDELQQQIHHLQAGRDLLQHFLRCQHDDITECPYLDAELIQHTPRGRIPTSDLIAAAQWNTPTPPAPRAPPSPPAPTAGTALCQRCGRAYHLAATGRPRAYCTHACRQATYRDRHNEHRK